MNLKGAVVAVTGAGRGIGRALVLELVRSGARVSFCGRQEASLAQVSRDAAGAGFQGQKILSMPCDVSNAPQVEAWIKKTKDVFGRIDVLINNASLLGPRVPIVEYPQHDWEDVMKVNALGPFLAAKIVIRQAMLEQKSGLIINVSSGVGRVGKANWGAYAASKFALEGFSQVLARELAAEGIISVAVNPEATRTIMRANAYPQEDPNILKTPEDFAKALVRFMTRVSPADSGRSFDYKDL